MLESNKILILTYIILLYFVIPGKVIAQNWVWAKSMGGLNNEASLSIVVDNSGNIYNTGCFSGTTDFDPGAGVFNLTSTGIRDVFITKVDSNGNFIWANALIGTGSTVGKSIAVDSFGNSYITGYFEGTVDFNPSSAVYYGTSAGSFDMFICKLSSLGVFEWVKIIGGIDDDRGSSILVDSSNDIYVAGFFMGTVDFDPSSNGYILNHTGLGSGIFITKYDSEGVSLWTKVITGTGGTNSSGYISICTNISADIFITGDFTGQFDFDPGVGNFPLSTTGVIGVSNGFICKLDLNGNFGWAKAFNGTGSCGTTSIKFDTLGYLYITGGYGGTIDFDPNPSTFNLTSLGNSDVFIAKFTAFGNLVWVKSVGSTSQDGGYSINIDNIKNVYVTGTFRESVDFDPNIGVYNLTSTGSWDIFVLKLDSTGNFIWAKRIGGFNNDGASSLTITPSQSLYISGYFSSSSILFDSINLFNFTQAGSTSDIFLAKLNYAMVIPVKLVNFLAFSRSNTTFLQWQTSNEINAYNYEIQHSNNGRDFEMIGMLGATSSPGTNEYNYTHNNPSVGINYYRLKVVDLDGQFEYSKIIKIIIAKYNSIIYPNPAGSIITIIPTNKLKNIEVLDMSGRKILQWEPSINNKYSLERLPIGNYLLKIFHHNSFEVIQLNKSE